MKQKDKTPNSMAKNLDKALIAILALVIIAVTYGAYTAYTNLLNTSKEVTTAVQKSRQEAAPMQNLDEMEENNNKYRDVLEITPKLTVPVAEVQTVGATDLEKYAKLTGIRITNTDFGGGSSTQEDGASSSAANTIAIKTTGSYPMNSILQFVQLIENNLPAMHLTAIELQGTDGANVKLNSMTIGVATK